MSDIDKIKAGERQTYYGSGRQPWDDIVDQGWGPAFAAGNVLKYLRRSKEPEKDREKAKWYFTAIRNMIADDNYIAINVYTRLMVILNQEERDKLDV